MKEVLIEIKIDKSSIESSGTSSISSSISSGTISELYDEAIKLNEEEERFYVALDCVGHSCFYKRTFEGFFALASGYSPPYDIYKEPVKIDKDGIKDVFTNYRSHGFHCSREITEEEYMEEIKLNIQRGV